MKKICFVIVAVMMTTVGALAQIPSNVQEVMDKCNAKMSSYNSGAGFVLDGTLKMSAQRNRPYCALCWILRMMPKLTPVRRLICRMLAPKSFNCLMMRLRSSFSHRSGDGSRLLS